MKTNITKSDNKIIQRHKKNKYLSSKDFNKLNPNILSINSEFNNNVIYKNKTIKFKNNLVGTVLQSGFLKINPFLFGLSKYKIKNPNLSQLIKKEDYFNKQKISTNLNRAKRKTSLKEKQVSRISFRMSTNTSTMIFAGSGSGKTQGVVAPTVLANAMSPAKPSMIITDPKGELYRNTYEILKENNYEIKVINLLDKENSDCISPFNETKQLIKKWVNLNLNVLLENNQAKTITSLIDQEIVEIIAVTTKDSKSDDFWLRKAQDTLRMIIWLIIDDCLASFYKLEFEKRTMETLNKLLFKLNYQSAFKITNSLWKGNYLKFYLDNYKIDLINSDKNIIDDFGKVHRGVNGWFSSLEKESLAQDILSTLTTSLKMFNNPILEKISIFNTFNFNDLVQNKPTALFIAMDNNNESLLAYVSWFINYLINWVSKYALNAKFGTLEKPILFLLEELGNIPFISALSNLVNEGRGKNLISSMVFQSYAQYQALYRDKGLIHSVENLMILNNRDEILGQKISEIAGEYQFFGKDKKMEILPRLKVGDVGEVPLKQALVLGKKITIPYLTYLIPFHFFEKKSLDKIIIKRDNLNEEVSDYIYSPLTYLDKNGGEFNKPFYNSMNKMNLSNPQTTFHFDYLPYTIYCSEKTRDDLKQLSKKYAKRVIPIIEEQNDELKWLLWYQNSFKLSAKKEAIFNFENKIILSEFKTLNWEIQEAMIKFKKFIELKNIQKNATTILMLENEFMNKIRESLTILNSFKRILDKQNFNKVQFGELIFKNKGIIKFWVYLSYLDIVSLNEMNNFIKKLNSINPEWNEILELNLFSDLLTKLE